VGAPFPRKASGSIPHRISTWMAFDVTDYSLQACLDARYLGRPLGKKGGTPEEQGDHFFSCGELELAADAYAACSSPTDRVRAKLGWCLAALDRFDEAEGLLTPETVRLKFVGTGDARIGYCGRLEPFKVAWRLRIERR